MVKVADVDQHHEQVKQSDARILHAPETYPSGKRQYSVEALGRHVWTVIQSVADVPPEEWGGQFVNPRQRRE